MKELWSSVPLLGSTTAPTPFYIIHRLLVECGVLIRGESFRFSLQLERGLPLIHIPFSSTFLFLIRSIYVYILETILRLFSYYIPHIRFNSMCASIFFFLYYFSSPPAISLALYFHFFTLDVNKKKKTNKQIKYKEEIPGRPWPLTRFCCYINLTENRYTYLYNVYIFS